MRERETLCTEQVSRAPVHVCMHACVVCVVMTNREATVSLFSIWRHLSPLGTRCTLLIHTHILANFYKYLDRFNVLEMLFRDPP